MSAVHHVILTMLFLLIGCCVGSFVNVCASRIPRGLSVLRPRSYCPRCRTAILARDNVPIFGWLFLRGQCRACGSRISMRYLLVELGMGLAFAGVYLARVVLTPGDLWEHNGAVGVLVPLLMLWTTISIGVSATLMVVDAKAGSPRPAHVSGIGGQDQSLSRLERTGCVDPIRVQFGNLVGPARVTQSIPGDASDGLVEADHMERRTAPGVTRESAR